MSYHLKKISKVQEEIEEYIDAKKQKCEIMQELELSDIYGALEAVALANGLTMKDLKKMSELTKIAFESAS